VNRLRSRDAGVMLLLALLPVVAHAPAWWGGRLLGPGDGFALHLPLRAAVWDAYRHGRVPSWNPSEFGGAPLLASYRPGALHPLMPVLAGFEAFTAFQLLVLVSLAAAAVLSFLYLRRLGANLVGAYFAGFAFALGPYLVGHLGDTATVVAAPLLPLVLLAAESHMNRSTPGRAAGLAVAVALLCLAGSPEAARAGGALVLGRLLVGHLLFPRNRGPSIGSSLLTVVAGVALAAPQLVPTLLVLPEAGQQITGVADTSQPLPGFAGLILRYVSHTPAAPLVLAALPLAFFADAPRPLALTQMPVRVLGAALALCLALQWGRGPLAAPGALALAFDFTLAVLAGLVLSALWDARQDAVGRRLRAYFLFACLAGAAALSVAATVLGPLPQTLAGAVGILALALILFFALAESQDPVVAGVFLLPLTVAFLLQPHGRRAWDGAPERAALEAGTATRQAIDRILGPRREERVLTLAREWPAGRELDLAWAGLARFAGRRSVNGYDPMAPLRTRRAWGGMSSAGLLPGAFFRGDVARLERLGTRWIQLPTTALASGVDEHLLGETLDLPLEAGRPRYLPTPFVTATEVRLSTWLADAVVVPHETLVAWLDVHLASGRLLSLPLRAGLDTAEWAWDGPDVRAVVAHGRAEVVEDVPDPGTGRPGHRYLARVALPGRYLVSGLGLRREPGPGRLYLGRAGLVDAGARARGVSLAAAYVSDAARVREIAATPGVRLFELPRSPAPAHVVASLERLDSEAAVLAALAAPEADGPDPARTAVGLAADLESLRLPAGAVASRAERVRAQAGRLELRALGPGLLVVAESWDPGWTAVVDDRPQAVYRVNHAELAVALGPGAHRVLLRHSAVGLGEGLLLMALALAGMVASGLRQRARLRAARASAVRV